MLISDCSPDVCSSDLFVNFTYSHLPDIQEPLLTTNSAIAFCAAVDRNGYLSTHNLKYCQPQGSDPVWNAANARNRRIFNDPVGLACGQNTKPYLLQCYRRDRSEEHTSELQSLMRISYAVFCLKKKKNCSNYLIYYTDTIINSTKNTQ